MNNKSTLLKQKLDTLPFLIVAHRGQYRGNIIENSIEAMKLALNQQADIVETDLMSSSDGVLYLFHDDREQALFGRAFNVSELNSVCIDNLSMLNTIGCVSGKRLNRLEDALKALKGDCLINLDRAWYLSKLMLPLLDQYNVVDQVILKSSIDKEEYLYRLSEHPVKYMFVAIVQTKEEVELFLELNDINLIGFELSIKDHHAPLDDPEFIKSLRDRGYLIWRNALVLDAKYAGLGFGDDIAMTGDEDTGWGQLVAQHANVIQTDWVQDLATYRHKMDRNK